MSVLASFKSFLTVSRNIKLFKSLAPDFHEMVFYAETKNDWIYFEGLIEELLKRGQKITYLTSDIEDGVFSQQSDQLKVFYIGEGVGRTMLFREIQAKVFVMTLPDLDTFYLKRSGFDVHYVYLFHSIVSTHMIYRHKAFDAYDSVFLVGPHHSEEIRETESLFQLKKKELVEFGYYRLEKLIREREEEQKKSGAVSSDEKEFTILLAPSWGENSISDLCLEETLRPLLQTGHNIIYRPHPMSLRKAEFVEEVKRKFCSFENFTFDCDIRSSKSLRQADIMIGDWSGAALEFSFCFERPLIFIDTPRKKNNSEFEKFKSVPLEASIREKIGQVVSLDELESLPEKVENMRASYNDLVEQVRAERAKWVYHQGNSSVVGADYLIARVKS